MANPLDFVTEDQSDDGLTPFEQAKMRAISIRPTGPDLVSAGNDPLTKAVAPEAPTDIMALIEKVKAYVNGVPGTVGPTPGADRMVNRLLGTGGEERFQTWPERMIRSGATLPGDVMSGAEPVVDPDTGRTSERVIERAQDIAGLAGGSALTQRGSSATLGSGPVRSSMKKSYQDLVEHPSLNGEQKQALFQIDMHSWFDQLAASIEENEGINYSSAMRRVKKMWKDGPQWVVKELDGGASSGTGVLPDHVMSLFSDTQQPGAAIAAAASSKGPAPVFYSALEHAATNAAQETMSPQQWLGYLKNQPGVKAEELQWTGLPDWLNGQKGKIKKEDVQAYLDEHKVEIKNVTKSETSEPPEGQYPTDEQMAGAKYSSYQLPGGENYREHLLTMPTQNMKQWQKLQDKAERTPAEREEYLKLSREANDYRSSHWDEPNVLAHVRTNDRVVDGQKSLHIEEIQSDWHQQGRKQGYKGDVDVGALEKKTNVSYQNLVAEIRKNQPELDKKGANTVAMDLLDSIRDKKQPLYSFSKEEQALGQKWHGDMEAYVQASADSLKPKVPDAPFKTSWPELALKRMIRHAAENGYDRISWTPGEAQAARYDLSRQIERLAYDPESNRLVGFAKGNRGNTPQIDKKVAPDKLADEIGKEAADKILNSPSSKGKLPMFPGEYNHLENADLKVGGEGMRKFYDKMLPKMAEKIGKAHGVKVKQTEIPAGVREDVWGTWKGPEYTPEQFHDKVKGIRQSQDLTTNLSRQLDLVSKDIEAGKSVGEAVQAHASKGLAKLLGGDLIPIPRTQPVHYFDLPQSLRDHAVGKGFPLYMSSIPFPLTPVDHDPFKKDE